MYDFEALNKKSKRTVAEGINTEEMNFKPLKDYIGKEIKVHGFFFTKSKYGTQVVVVGDDAKINLPKRYTEDWENLRDCDEALADLLAGHLALTDICECQSDNGKSVCYRFKNI